MIDSWKNHPELQDGEILLVNASDDDWNEIKNVYPSARKGSIAYTRTGEQLADSFRNYYPIFVSSKDIPSEGIEGIYDSRIINQGE